MLQKIAPSNGANRDKYSEQRYHKSLKKHQFRARLALFKCKWGANLMHSLVGKEEH